MGKPRTVGIRLNPALYHRLASIAGKDGTTPTTLARNIVAKHLIRQPRQPPAAATPADGSESLAPKRCVFCNGTGWVTDANSPPKITLELIGGRKVEYAPAPFARKCGCRDEPPF